MCFLTGIVTGIHEDASNAAFPRVKKSKCQHSEILNVKFACTNRYHTDCCLWQSIKVVKHSSISTGQLRRLHALHSQPINLVVFQGSSGPKSNET